MTLTKKMDLWVVLIFLLIFIGTFMITFVNERRYFVEQMASNAQNAATSLSLSLSATKAYKNKKTLVSLVENIFDRGYFAFIEVRDLDGSLIAARYGTNRNGSVPGWFVDWVKWPMKSQKASFMDGWRPAGEVWVKSNYDYVLGVLWQNACSLAFAYLLFGVVILALVYFFIQWLSKPLERITRQAKAICNQNFAVETEIPKTFEFRKVTLAMNQMVNRLKALFVEQSKQIETLRYQAFQDALTGLGNRRYFFQYMNTLLNYKEEYIPGFIILVTVRGLLGFNKKFGFQAGDALITQIAEFCRENWQGNSNIFRITGTNFAIIIQEPKIENFVLKCNDFNTKLQRQLANRLPTLTYLVADAYYFHQPIDNLLINLDKILNANADNSCKLFYNQQIYKDNLSILDKNAIETALKQQAFSLTQQTVTNETSIFHQEIFVQWLYKQQELIAGYFMPIAEGLKLGHLIDAYVLEKASALLNIPIAINLSIQTITKAAYQKNLLTYVKNLAKDQRDNLYIEISETIVLERFNQVARFIERLRALDVKVGIDKVGIKFASLDYLNQLPINYIKLHGSLTQEVVDDQHKQFFIHYFMELATTLGIQIIATQVEQPDQWQALKAIGIRWGQGRLFEQ